MLAAALPLKRPASLAKYPSLACFAIRRVPVAPYLRHETVKKPRYGTMEDQIASFLCGPKARAERLARR